MFLQKKRVLNASVPPFYLAGFIKRLYTSEGLNEKSQSLGLRGHKHGAGVIARNLEINLIL